MKEKIEKLGLSIGFPLVMGWFTIGLLSEVVAPACHATAMRAFLTPATNVLNAAMCVCFGIRFVWWLAWQEQPGLKSSQPGTSTVKKPEVEGKYRYWCPECERSVSKATTGTYLCAHLDDIPVGTIEKPGQIYDEVTPKLVRMKRVLTHGELWEGK